MKNVTKNQLREALEAAYRLGWKDRTSYHDQGTQYWGNVTRKQHDEMLRENRDNHFKNIIGNLT